MFLGLKYDLAFNLVVDNLKSWGCHDARGSVYFLSFVSKTFELSVTYQDSIKLVLVNLKQCSDIFLCHVFRKIKFSEIHFNHVLNISSSSMKIHFNSEF